MTKNCSRTIASVAALFVAFGLGYASHAVVLADGGDETAHPYEQLDTFAQVLSQIERRYVEDIDADALIYGAIKGMVDTLDPHSAFLTPEEHQAMRNETRGEYVGVGIELGSRDGEITVIAPYEGGPAFEAGVEPGDVIIAVDGQRTRDLTRYDVVNLVRGERGETVELRVRRTDADGLLTEHAFTIVRDVIRMQAVSSELVTPGYGLIDIDSFQLGVSADTVSAIDSLTVENGSELEGLILDLRNDPGGLLSEGVMVSDLFLDEGVVVTTEGRSNEEDTTHHSRDGTTRYQGPLVVLVNDGTASASEIVAGALQDRDRAAIIGERTYGKGTVQSIIEFQDGSGLKLTVARYYSPDHRSIHGEGIEPDFVVEPGIVPAESPDASHLAPPEGFDPVVDALIQAALDQLRGLE